MATNKLIVILGPTASGKTGLAIKLAKKLDGEVVSADSRQIYKEMNIGTAKPMDLEQIPHHLLNIKNPNQPYSVAEYKEDAIKAIKDIQKRGKLPILVGGTGLYIKAVVENLDIPRVEANPAIRESIEKEISEKGLDFVFKKLVKLDPEAAYTIDPKNPRRVIRALEVTLLTKKPFTAQKKTGSPLFNVLEVGILVEKEELKERISARIDQMIKDGLVEEVENLQKKYGSQQAFDAIGYREIIDYLNEKISLEKAIEDMKINTWHYAKRQITWFKRDPRIKWTDNQKQAEGFLRSFVDN